MCFVIHKDHPKAKVAEKDIRAFKRLLWDEQSKALLTPVKFFKYKPNKLYKSSFTYSGFTNNHINKGRHSYSSLKKAKLLSLWSSSKVICEFIIPKGSEYYYNPKLEEYVSNKIMWTGRVYRTDRWVEFKGKITEKYGNV